MGAIFIAFSTLEALCILLVTYLIFRFPVRKRLALKILVASIFISVVSYLLRDVFALKSASYVVPLAYLLTFTLFIKFFSRVQFVWAFVMTLTGYSMYVVFSVIVMMIFQLFGVDLAAIQANIWLNSLVQIITVGTALPLSYLHYYRGGGFAYDFPRWSPKHIWLVLLVVGVTVVIMRVLFINTLLMGIVAFSAILVVFLLLSRTMERREAHANLE